MNILKSIEELRASALPPRSVVAIGNFDGFHLGHQALLQEAKSLANRHQLTWGMISFWPHTRSLFGRGPRKPLLSPAQRQEALAATGADLFCLQPFTREFASQSPRDFLVRLGTREGGVKGIVVGENFRFGEQRRGDGAILEDYCKRESLYCRICPPVRMGDQVVSSTLIREALKKGDIPLANQALGRPYMLEGEIKKGDQIGRTIGFPTANLSQLAQFLPGPGVFGAYACFSELTAKTFPAVVHLGERPTLKDKELRVEVHVVGEAFSLDALYGQRARVYFLGKVRDERSFPDLSHLKQQIKQDIAQAEPLFGSPPPTYWGI